MDIHAGGIETSLMLKNFSELVDINLARRLKSSLTTLEELRIWQCGGQMAKDITPLGCCGNPSEIDIDKAHEFEDEIVDGIAQVIYSLIKKVPEE